MATGLPAGSIVGGDDGDLLAYETATGALVWEAPDGVCGYPQGKEVSPMNYHYRLLDPRPAAREQELAFLASTPCLGVEVTVPELAEKCLLGNLDPQHAGQDAGTSAIEAALTCPLPPAGTTLVTVRPDADAYGAMAVLTLRQEDGMFSHGLAGEIGAADRGAQGFWRYGDPIDDVAPSEALAAACLATRDPEQGVQMMRQYLQTGRFTGQEQWTETVRKERREQSDIAASVSVVADGRIAVVESTSRFAVQVAYTSAPVVVAVNPQFRRPGAAPDEPAHRKVTVCQKTPGHVDMAAVFADLSAVEPGWGGSPTIGGSPQGVASTIPTGQVTETVRRHLTPA